MTSAHNNGNQMIVKGINAGNIKHHRGAGMLISGIRPMLRLITCRGSSSISICRNLNTFDPLFAVALHIGVNMQTDCFARFSEADFLSELTDSIKRIWVSQPSGLVIGGFAVKSSNTDTPRFIEQVWFVRQMIGQGVHREWLVGQIQNLCGR